MTWLELGKGVSPQCLCVCVYCVCGCVYVRVCMCFDLAGAACNASLLWRARGILI
jgi:hypothetical protein